MPGNEVNSGNGELDCGISGLAGNGRLRRARELRLQASASGLKSDETPLRLTLGARFVPGWRNLGGRPARALLTQTLSIRGQASNISTAKIPTSHAGRGTPLLYNSRASSFLTVKIL